MLIKKVPFFLILMLVFTVALSAQTVDYEGIAARFLKAFQRSDPFAKIRSFFYHVNDVDSFIIHLKNSSPDSKIGRIMLESLKRIEKPSQRALYEKSVLQGMKNAKVAWERILNHPTDQGTAVKLLRMKMKVRFEPFKYYEFRFLGKYTYRKRVKSISMSVDFMILKDRVRIVSFRAR